MADFIDALPMLELAIKELSPGQMIKDDRLTLMDLMGAGEVSIAVPCVLRHDSC